MEITEEREGGPKKRKGKEKGRKLRFRPFLYNLRQTYHLSIYLIIKSYQVYL